MGKHLLAILIIIITVCLGYGLWLYSESLRTNQTFTILLRDDIADKKQLLQELTSK